MANRAELSGPGYAGLGEHEGMVSSVKDSYSIVLSRLYAGLPCLADDHFRVRSLTAWPWIISLNLNAY